MSYLYNTDGVPRKISDLRAVEHLFKLKEKNGANPWPVIENIIDIWVQKRPKEWQSYLIDLEKTRKTRKDSKYASTYDKKHGGYLRYTLDIPETVIYMIRAVYSPDELPMNKKFFHEWSRRFPKMKVAQKV